MAVLGSDGTLNVVGTATLDACLQIPGCVEAVMAPAGAGHEAIALLFDIQLKTHEVHVRTHARQCRNYIMLIISYTLMVQVQVQGLGQPVQTSSCCPRAAVTLPRTAAGAGKWRRLLRGLLQSIWRNLSQHRTGLQPLIWRNSTAFPLTLCTSAPRTKSIFLVNLPDCSQLEI